MLQCLEMKKGLSILRAAMALAYGSVPFFLGVGRQHFPPKGLKGSPWRDCRNWAVLKRALLM